MEGLLSTEPTPSSLMTSLFVELSFSHIFLSDLRTFKLLTNLNQCLSRSNSGILTKTAPFYYRPHAMRSSKEIGMGLALGLDNQYTVQSSL